MTRDGEMSPLREGAIQLHEMYTELRRAGFSRSEALKLVSEVIGKGIESAGDNEKPNDD